MRGLMSPDTVPIVTDTLPNKKQTAQGHKLVFIVAVVCQWPTQHVDIHIYIYICNIPAALRPPVLVVRRSWTVDPRSSFVVAVYSRGRSSES